MGKNLRRGSALPSHRAAAGRVLQGYAEILRATPHCTPERRRDKEIKGDKEIQITKSSAFLYSSPAPDACSGPISRHTLSPHGSKRNGPSHHSWGRALCSASALPPLRFSTAVSAATHHITRLFQIKGKLAKKRKKKTEEVFFFLLSFGRVFLTRVSSLNYFPMPPHQSPVPAKRKHSRQECSKQQHWLQTDAKTMASVTLLASDSSYPCIITQAALSSARDLLAKSVYT